MDYQLFSNSLNNFMLNKRVFAYTSAIAFIFFSSFSTFANTPCWLTNLNIEHKAMYGVSSKISASSRPALHFAKANAVNNWLLSEGLKTQTFSDDLSELKEYAVQGQTLYFLDEYQEQNKIYSLVSSSKDYSAKQCEITTCNIKQCSPAWLCGNKSDRVSIIGVASRSALANNQMLGIIKNAQSLARIINNAHVKGDISSYHSNSNLLSISNIQERYSITDLDSKNPKVTIGEMCYLSGTLFSEVLLSSENMVSSHDWMVQPLLGNILGVVGHAKGQTSTGRLSSLLQVAVRRGLFEMAKAKNIKVENNLKLALNRQGYYSLVRQSHQSTESVVSAYIADMKMKINEKLQPEIFIWLLENKDKL